MTKPTAVWCDMHDCDQPARWAVSGRSVKPHCVCDGHKAEWEMIGDGWLHPPQFEALAEPDPKEPT